MRVDTIIETLSQTTAWHLDAWFQGKSLPLVVR